MLESKMRELIAAQNAECIDAEVVAPAAESVQLAYKAPAVEPQPAEEHLTVQERHDRFLLWQASLPKRRAPESE
jgi:hypothetical protein